MNFDCDITPTCFPKTALNAPPLQYEIEFHFQFLLARSLWL